MRPLVYVPPSKSGRGPDPPLSKGPAVKGTLLLVSIVMVSRALQFAVRRRRTREPARVAALVVEHHASFVAIRASRGDDAWIAFARWDGAAYRTLEGVTVTTEEGATCAIAPGIPVLYHPFAMSPMDDRGETLAITANMKLWLLARLRERPEGFRVGASRLVPILDRFVLVGDDPAAGGPFAPSVERPKWLGLLVYPTLPIAITLWVVVRSDPESTIGAWAIGIAFLLLVIECFTWMWLAGPTPKRG